MKRVLRPGGIFIFREHDLHLQGHGASSATSAPVAMLDLAHSVFNAVTGVSIDEEANEIRAFRPIFEWRRIMAKMGLVDSMLYGFEQGDCTYDFMLCFTNGPVSVIQASPSQLMNPPPLQDDEEPAMMAMIRALLAQIPAAVAGAAEIIVEKLLNILPAILDNLRNFILADVPKAVADDAHKRELLGLDVIPLFSAEAIVEYAILAESFLRDNLERLTEIGYGARDLLRDIHIRETSNIVGLLTMPKLFLVLPLLKRKMALFPEGIGEAEKMLVGMVENTFPVLLQIRDSSIEPTESVDVSTIVTASGEGQASFGRLKIEESIVADGSVDKEDVLGVIVYLGQQIPGLLDPSIVLAGSGFTLSQQLWLDLSPYKTCLLSPKTWPSTMTSVAGSTYGGYLLGTPLVQYKSSLWHKLKICRQKNYCFPRNGIIRGIERSKHFSKVRE